ncbi:MAG: hypothetical protein ABJG41_01260 [Cyclobacteriaceae bacterium]
MENPFIHLLIGDYIACLVGILILIVRSFKIASDEFEESNEDFDSLHYLKKNFWDFILFIFSGFGALLIVGELYANNPEWFEKIGLKSGGTYKYLLSLIAGLLGSVFISALLSFKRK